MRKIILASTSPYRKEALRMLGVDFKVAVSDIDENFFGRPSDPLKLVRILARKKAQAVAKNYSKEIVIGLDSVGWFSNSILEKPRTKEEAYGRLVSLSGNDFQFYTGICIIDTKYGKKYERQALTDVLMRKIRTYEISKYLSEDPNYKTYALGFDPLGHSSASFVKAIDGSYNNLLRGIPLETIAELLRNIEEKERGRS
jgi:septum formation protein